VGFPVDKLPKRYRIDESGRRVLVGLSIEETFEFETLSDLAPLDDSGSPFPWRDGVPIEETSNASRDKLCPLLIEEIRRGADKRPIFYLSSLGSKTLECRPLAAKIRGDRSIIGIEIGGLPLTVLRSMKETARRVTLEIRRLQPIGPYCIIGYSFGGNLGIEVAWQLISLGQAIEQLIILEADLCKSSPNLLGKIAQQLWALSDKTFREKFEYLVRKFRHRLSWTQPFSNEVTRACFDAYKSHVPKPFFVSIVFFLSVIMNGWLSTSRDLTLGWGEVCSDGVEVIPVPCNHSQFFEEPYVSNIAAHINSVIRD
jgi:thioesterase domain-containing protein